MPELFLAEPEVNAATPDLKLKTWEKTYTLRDFIELSLWPNRAV
jgi:hypothetical protein